MTSEAATEAFTEAIERAATDVCLTLDRCFDADKSTDGEVGGNVVDALDRVAQSTGAVARAIRLLGNSDAATPMGAIEAHGNAMLESAGLIADAIRELADAVGKAKR